MELELKKECLDTYEPGEPQTLTQEETTETIVPDHLCGGRSLSPWRSGAGGTFRHGQGHGVIHPGK